MRWKLFLKIAALDFLSAVIIVAATRAYVMNGFSEPQSQTFSLG